MRGAEVAPVTSYTKSPVPVAEPHCSSQNLHPESDGVIVTKQPNNGLLVTFQRFTEINLDMSGQEGEIGSAFIPALFKPSALLPVAQQKDRLLYLIETFPITIVVGHTGSGKTTQIPKFLYESGWCNDGKQIAVTQVG